MANWVGPTHKCQRGRCLLPATWGTQTWGCMLCSPLCGSWPRPGLPRARGEGVACHGVRPSGRRGPRGCTKNKKKWFYRFPSFLGGGGDSQAGRNTVTNKSICPGLVVPCVLQVGVLVCPALFHHVQAHSGGAAFLPFFNFSHFLAVCGQIQCFFFQWHFSDFVVPLKPAML